MPTKDKRKKGCPNEQCKYNQKHIFFKAEDNYCIHCGTPLIFVCKSCYKKIDADDVERDICLRCAADPTPKIQKIADKAKQDVANAALAGIGAVAGVAEFGIDVVKEAGPEIVRAVKRVAEEKNEKNE